MTSKAPTPPPSETGEVVNRPDPPLPPPKKQTTADKIVDSLKDFAERIECSTLDGLRKTYVSTTHTKGAPMNKRRTRAVPITEGPMCKGGINPPNPSDARPPEPQGSGGNRPTRNDAPSWAKDSCEVAHRILTKLGIEYEIEYLAAGVTDISFDAYVVVSTDLGDRWSAFTCHPGPSFDEDQSDVIRKQISEPSVFIEDAISPCLQEWVTEFTSRMQSEVFQEQIR